MAGEAQYINREVSDKLYNNLGSRAGRFTADEFYAKLSDDSFRNRVVSSLRASDSAKSSFMKKLTTMPEPERNENQVQSESIINNISQPSVISEYQTPSQKSKYNTDGITGLAPVDGSPEPAKQALFNDRWLEQNKNNYSGKSALDSLGDRFFGRSKDFEDEYNAIPEYTQQDLEYMKDKQKDIDSKMSQIPQAIVETFDRNNPQLAISAGRNPLRKIGEEKYVSTFSAPIDATKLPWQSDEDFKRQINDAELQVAQRRIEEEARNIRSAEEIKSELSEIESKLPESYTLGRAIGAGATPEGAVAKQQYIQVMFNPEMRKLKKRADQLRQQLKMREQIDSIRSIGDDYGKVRTFIKGMKDEKDFESWYTFGLSDMAERNRISAIYEKASKGKKLTNDELETLKLYNNLQDAKNGAPKAYTWGGNFANTAAFCLEFVLTDLATGGVGGLAGAINKMLKTGAKGSRALVLRKLGANAMYDLAVTPITPMFWNTLSQETLNQYGMNYVYGGNAYVSKDAKAIGERMWRAYAQAFSERFTESIGNIIGQYGLTGRLMRSKWSKDHLNGFFAKIADKLDNTPFGQQVGKINEMMRVSDMPMEVVEEMINIPIQSALLWENQFYDKKTGKLIYADWDFYKEILLDTALLGGFSLAGGGAIVGKQKMFERAKLNNDWKKYSNILLTLDYASGIPIENLQNRSAELQNRLDGMSGEQFQFSRYNIQKEKNEIDAAIELAKASGLDYVPKRTDDVEKMDNIYSFVTGNDMSNKNNVSQAYKMLGELPANPGTYDFHIVMENYLQTSIQREGLIKGLVVEMEEAMGPMAYKKDNGKTVKTATDVDGNRWYITDYDEYYNTYAVRDINDAGKTTLKHADDIKSIETESIEDVLAKWMAYERSNVAQVENSPVEAAEDVASSTDEVGIGTEEETPAPSVAFNYKEGDRVSFGNTTYKIQRIEGEEVYLETENGMPLNKPVLLKDVRPLTKEENNVVDQTDGSQPEQSENGIQVGSTVNYEGKPYEVTSINDDGTLELTDDNARVKHNVPQDKIGDVDTSTTQNDVNTENVSLDDLAKVNPEGYVSRIFTDMPDDVAKQMVNGKISSLQAEIEKKRKSLGKLLNSGKTDEYVKVNAEIKELEDIINRLTSSMTSSVAKISGESVEETGPSGTDVPDATSDKASAARDRGYRVVNGERIDRQPENMPVIVGKDTEVMFGTKKKKKARWAVAELKNVQSAHIDRNVNYKHFLPEAQPKKRTDNASEMAAVDIAKNLNPEQITKGTTAFVGAPSVNTRLESIQGNNRINALMKLYRMFKEKAKEYKQYLIDNAAEFGINPSDIESMEQPVLVRILDVDDTEAIQLGQYVAQDTESGGERFVDAGRVFTALKSRNLLKDFADILLRGIDIAESTRIEDVAVKNGYDAVAFLRKNNIIDDTIYQSSFVNPDSDSKKITPETRVELVDVIKNILTKGGIDNLEMMFDSLPPAIHSTMLELAAKDSLSGPKSMISDLRKVIEVLYHIISTKDYKGAKVLDRGRAIDAWRVQTDSETNKTPDEIYGKFAIDLAKVFVSDNTKAGLSAVFLDFYNYLYGTNATVFGTAIEPHTKQQSYKDKFGIEYGNDGRNETPASVESGNKPSGTGESESDTAPGTGNQKQEGETGISSEPTDVGETEETTGGDDVETEIEKPEKQKSFFDEALDAVQKTTSRKITIRNWNEDNIAGDAIIDGKDINLKLYTILPSDSILDKAKYVLAWSAPIDESTEGYWDIVEGLIDEYNKINGTNIATWSDTGYVYNNSKGNNSDDIIKFAEWANNRIKAEVQTKEETTTKPEPESETTKHEEKPAEPTNKELTEDEIRNSEYGDTDVIESAVDFINGNDTSFAAQIAYQNIKEYVRSKSDNSKPNSGNENTTQLASSANATSAGENKPGGNQTEQVDNGAVPGRGGIPSNQESPSKPSGTRGNQRVQGNVSNGVSGPSGNIQSGRPNSGSGRGNELHDGRGNKTQGTESSKPNNGTGTDAGSTDVSSLEDELTSLINGFGSHPSIESNTVIVQEEPHSSFIRRKFYSLAKKLFGFDSADTRPERDDVLSRKRPKIVPVALSTEGLSQSDIILFGKIIFGAAKTGYAVAKTTSLFSKKDFSRYFTSKFSNIIKEKMGYDDAHIISLIDEAWNTKLNINGERLPLAQHVGNMRDSEIRGWFGKTKEERAEEQKAKNGVVGKNKYADRNEIKEDLPILQPGQWDDVVFAERQFFDPSHNDYDHVFGKGVLVTNGTGTGKTFTGLGVVKRFLKEGKKNILIVCPANMKPDWMKTARFFDMEISELNDKKDAGKDVSITSYENFRDNNEIMSREFDLVVYDECQNIVMNQQGDETLAYNAHIMVTNKDVDSASERMLSATPEGKRRFELSKQKEELERQLAKAKTTEVFDIRIKIDEVESEMSDITRKLNALKPSLTDKAKESVGKTKVLMLSATPFNTVRNLKIAEGIAFNYPKVIRSDGSENTKADAKYGNFMTEWFSGDSRSNDEIDFGDHLLDELETMQFRELENGFDYSRDFPDVSGKVKAVMFNEAWRFIMSSPLRNYATFLSNPIWTTQLFEVMKVSAIKDRIQQHLDMGRKLILFHDRLHETRMSVDASGKEVPPVGPPFSTVIAMAKADSQATSDVAMAIQTFASQFGEILQWEQTLDYRPVPDQVIDMFATEADRERYVEEMAKYNKKVDEYTAKVNEIQTKYPELSFEELNNRKLLPKAPKRPKLKAESVCLFNGECTPKEKEDAKDEFNSDNGNKRIICVNTKSGGAGLSLHDTTGKFQRVMIGLALPVSPIGFIQCEGRPFRFGNMSNGIFEYPLLGIDLEAIIFAQSFNVKAETVENLSHGTQGRGLKASIMTQFYENGGNVPLAGQGVGSKEMDRRGNSLKGMAKAIHDLGVAIKKVIAKSDKSVPEPIGYKMSKLAGAMPGDIVMVPYAGRGCVSRYFDSNVNVESYSDNPETMATLAIVASGENLKIAEKPFEEVNEIKKGDIVIVGSVLRGRVAMETAVKGFKHTNPGGRLIAVMPEGEDFDNAINSLGKEAFIRTVITVGSNMLGNDTLKSRIFVIDRVANPKMREGKIANRIDLSYITSQDELFREIDQIVVPERIIDKEAIKIKKVKNVIAELKKNELVSSVTFNENSGDIHIEYKTTKGFKVAKIKFSSLCLPGSYYYQGNGEWIEIGDLKTTNQDSGWVRAYTRVKEYLDMDTDEMRKALWMDDSVKEEKVQAARDLLKSWVKFIKAASGFNDSQINRIKNGLKPEIDLADITDMVTLDILKEKFDTANESEELQEIFDKAFPIAVKSGVKLDDSPAGPGAAAEYDPKGHVLRFNKLAWNRADSRRKAAVLLHELIHSVTSYALDAYRFAFDVPEKLENAVDWIEKIYRAIQTGAPANVRLLSGSLSYALENTHEFLANITTQEVEDALRKRPMWVFENNGKKRVSGDKVEGWTEVSAWDLVKGAVNEIIDNFDEKTNNQYKRIASNYALHPELQDKIDNDILRNVTSAEQSLQDAEVNRTATEAVTTLLSDAGVNVEMVSEEVANEEAGENTRYRISSEIEREYPNWMENQVVAEGKKGQQTQVAGTVGTYKKVGNWIKENLPSGTTVLDASSGMGLGTIALNEIGIQTEDVEPYPSSERMKTNTPTYTSYNDVNKKYDYIISNAVLNVIPDDWRKEILLSMASKMNGGGKMFINTRKAGEEKGIKNKIELDTPQEVLVGTKEKITSYQKFFAPTELKEYVQNTLGNGYSVEIANEKNSGTSGLAAVVVTKNAPVQFRTSSGIVYGYTKNGVIYLNSERLNPNTPIHEYTHLWDGVCQQLNPELWRRGKELMKQTSVWNDVVSDDNYANIRNNEDAVASEVHSRLTGKQGAEMLEKLANEGNTATEKITARGLIGKLKKWLDSFWKWTKDTFTNWTKAEADAVTLDEFVNMPIGDLVRGKNPNDPFKGQRRGNQLLNSVRNNVERTGHLSAQDIESINETINLYENGEYISERLLPQEREGGRLLETLGRGFIGLQIAANIKRAGTEASSGTERKTEEQQQNEVLRKSVMQGQPMFDIRRPMTAVEEDMMKRASDLKEYELTFGERLWEFFGDKNKSVKKFLKIAKGRGVKVDSSTDAYVGLESSISRSTDQIEEEYNKPIYNHLCDAVFALKKKFEELGISTPETSFNDVGLFAMAMHAKERNRKICVDEIESYVRRKLITTDSYNALNSALREQGTSIREVCTQLYQNSFEDGDFDFGFLDNIDKDMVPLAETMKKAAVRKIKGIAKSDVKENRSGMRNGEADEYIAIFDREECRKEIGELKKWRDASNKFVLDEWLKFGAISKEEYKELTSMYENYVPLRGWDIKEELNLDDYLSNAAYNRGSSMVALNKHAFGRESLADNPFTYMKQLAVSSIIRGNRNLARQKMYNLLAENAGKLKDLAYIPKAYQVRTPDGEMEIWFEKPTAEQEDEGYELVATGYNKDYKWHSSYAEQKAKMVEVDFDGEKRFMVFNGKLGISVASAMRMDNDLMRLDDLITRALQRVTNIHKALLTSANPMFWYRNSWRDLRQALKIERNENGRGSRNNLLRHYFVAVGNVFMFEMDHGKKSKYYDLYQQFKIDGGRIGWSRMQSIDDLKREIEKEMKKRSKSGIYFLTERSAVRLVRKFWNAMSTASEVSVRFAEYMNSLDNGKDREAAARDAREITANFNHKGRGSSFLNIYFEFFSPTLTGDARIVNMVKNSKASRIAVDCALMVSSRIMLSLISAMMCEGDGDDEENTYDLLSEYRKFAYDIIPIPWGEKDRFLIIPRPHIFRGILNIGDQAAAVMRGKKTINEASHDWLMNMISDWSPIDVEAFDMKNLTIGDKLERMLLPTIARPIIENKQNRDYQGNKIHQDESIFEENTSPEYKKAGSRTGKAFIATSRALNNLAGGTDYRSAEYQIDEEGNIRESGFRGAFDINPSDIQHIIEGYGGGNFTIINNAFKTGESIADWLKSDDKDFDLDWNVVPITNLVMVQAGKSRSGYKYFFAAREQAKKAEDMLRNAEKAMNTDEIEKIHKANDEVIYLYNLYQQLLKDVGKTEYEGMSDSDRKQLQKTKDDLMESFKDDYLAIKNKQEK